MPIGDPILFDRFDGAASPLPGHVPNIGSAWYEAAGEQDIEIDGEGYAKGTTSDANNRCSSDVDLVDGDFTVEFKIRMTEDVVGAGNGYSEAGIDLFVFRPSDQGTIKFITLYVWAEAGAINAAYRTHDSSFFISDDLGLFNEKLITLVVSGTGTELSLYIDGTLIDSRTRNFEEFSWDISRARLGFFQQGDNRAAVFALNGVSITEETITTPYEYGDPTSIDVRIAFESMLHRLRSVVFHDVSSLLTGRIDRYVCDLVTPMGIVRVPISSWQSTLRVDASNYVQAAIPAAEDFVDVIAEATDLVIRRVAIDAEGMPVIEYMMARIPIETISYQRSHLTHSCNLSGYATGYESDDNPPIVLDRTLTQIRSISSTGNGLKVRCAVDWMLRPSHRAYVDGNPIIVSEITYYASAADAYMDVEGA